MSDNVINKQINEKKDENPMITQQQNIVNNSFSSGSFLYETDKLNRMNNGQNQANTLNEHEETYIKNKMEEAYSKTKEKVTSELRKGKDNLLTMTKVGNTFINGGYQYRNKKGITVAVESEKPILSYMNYKSELEGHISANHVRQEKVRHYNQLQKTDKKFNRKTAQAVDALIGEINQVDAEGNFQEVKESLIKLYDSYHMIREQNCTLELDVAENIVALYKEALAKADSYASSHSIWNGKALWSKGRARKNAAMKIGKALRSGWFFQELKDRIPFLDELPDRDSLSEEEYIKSQIDDGEQICRVIDQNLKIVLSQEALLNREEETKKKLKENDNEYSKNMLLVEQKKYMNKLNADRHFLAAMSKDEEKKLSSLRKLMSKADEKTYGKYYEKYQQIKKEIRKRIDLNKELPVKTEMLSFEAGSNRVKVSSTLIKARLKRGNPFLSEEGRIELERRDIQRKKAEDIEKQKKIEEERKKKEEREAAERKEREEREAAERKEKEEREARQEKEKANREKYDKKIIPEVNTLLDERNAARQQREASVNVPQISQEQAVERTEKIYGQNGVYAGYIAEMRKDYPDSLNESFFDQYNNGRIDLASMLDFVRFDDAGNVLPEYEEAHNENLRFLSSMVYDFAQNDRNYDIETIEKLSKEKEVHFADILKKVDNISWEYGNLEKLFEYGCDREMLEYNRRMLKSFVTLFEENQLTKDFCENYKITPTHLKMLKIKAKAYLEIDQDAMKLESAKEKSEEDYKNQLELIQKKMGEAIDSAVDNYRYESRIKLDIWGNRTIKRDLRGLIKDIYNIQEAEQIERSSMAAKQKNEQTLMMEEKLIFGKEKSKEYNEKAIAAFKASRNIRKAQQRYSAFSRKMIYRTYLTGLGDNIDKHCEKEMLTREDFMGYMLPVEFDENGNVKEEFKEADAKNFKVLEAMIMKDDGTKDYDKILRETINEMLNRCASIIPVIDSKRKLSDRSVDIEKLIYSNLYILVFENYNEYISPDRMSKLVTFPEGFLKYFTIRYNKIVTNISHEDSSFYFDHVLNLKSDGYLREYQSPEKIKGKKLKDKEDKEEALINGSVTDIQEVEAKIKGFWRWVDMMKKKASEGNKEAMSLFSNYKATEKTTWQDVRKEYLDYLTEDHQDAMSDYSEEIGKIQKNIEELEKQIDAETDLNKLNKLNVKLSEERQVQNSFNDNIVFCSDMKEIRDNNPDIIKQIRKSEIEEQHSDLRENIEKIDHNIALTEKALSSDSNKLSEAESKLSTLVQDATKYSKSMGEQYEVGKASKKTNTAYYVAKKLVENRKRLEEIKKEQSQLEAEIKTRGLNRMAGISIANDAEDEFKLNLRNGELEQEFNDVERNIEIYKNRMMGYAVHWGSTDSFEEYVGLREEIEKLSNAISEKEKNLQNYKEEKTVQEIKLKNIIDEELEKRYEYQKSEYEKVNAEWHEKYDSVLKKMENFASYNDSRIAENIKKYMDLKKDLDLIVNNPKNSSIMSWSLIRDRQKELVNQQKTLQDKYDQLAEDYDEDNENVLRQVEYDLDKVNKELENINKQADSQSQIVNSSDKLYDYQYLRSALKDMDDLFNETNNVANELIRAQRITELNEKIESLRKSDPVSLEKIQLIYEKENNAGDYSSVSYTINSYLEEKKRVDHLESEMNEYKVRLDEIRQKKTDNNVDENPVAIERKISALDSELYHAKNNLEMKMDQVKEFSDKPDMLIDYFSMQNELKKLSSAEE